MERGAWRAAVHGVSRGGHDLVTKQQNALSGAALGITEKMEAQPQPPLLISQARPRDEGVRPCDSDLFFPFFG